MGMLTTWGNGVLGEDGKESADFRGASCFRTMWGWCTQGRRGRGCCSTQAVGMSSVLREEMWNTVLGFWWVPCVLTLPPAPCSVRLSFKLPPPPSCLFAPLSSPGQCPGVTLSPLPNLCVPWDPDFSCITLSIVANSQAVVLRSLISGAFFPPLCSALENQGFEIIERGEIEVKGKGKMTTYFLIRNLHASEDEIMGRPQSLPDRKGEHKGKATSQWWIFFPLTTTSFSGALKHAGSARMSSVRTPFHLVEAPKDQSSQDEPLHPGESDVP